MHGLATPTSWGGGILGEWTPMEARGGMFIRAYLQPASQPTAGDTGGGVDLAARLRQLHPQLAGLHGRPGGHPGGPAACPGGGARVARAAERGVHSGVPQRPGFCFCHPFCNHSSSSQSWPFCPPTHNCIHIHEMLVVTLNIPPPLCAVKNDRKNTG